MYLTHGICNCMTFILYSFSINGIQSIAVFETGSFLPLPSREAVERSIGKGGNGTISVVYFKGAEFAVKRVSG